MADYGLTYDGSCDAIYIRQPNCAVLVRAKKSQYVNGLWDVDISDNGEDWQTVFVFGTENDALTARDNLVNFLNHEGNKSNIQASGGGNKKQR